MRKGSVRSRSLRFISIKELCSIFPIKEEEILILVQQKCIPMPYVFPGCDLIWRSDDVDNYIKKFITYEYFMENIGSVDLCYAQ